MYRRNFVRRRTRRVKAFRNKRVQISSLIDVAGVVVVIAVVIGVEVVIGVARG